MIVHDVVRDSLRDLVRARRIGGWYTYGEGEDRRWVVTGWVRYLPAMTDDQVASWLADRTFE